MKIMTINQFVHRYHIIDGPQGVNDPDYKSHLVWDSPILTVCQQYPRHTAFAEVRCKVGYINRLYKCILGGEKDLLSRHLDDAEECVASAFMNQGADAIMAELAKLPEFTNATLADVVRCHTRLVKIVASAISQNQLVFCSKYASFHYPEIVPILDSKSEGRAKRLVNELSKTSTYAEEDDSLQDENGSNRYENHCANLLMLIDLLRRKGVARPTLKKLDHVLYWS